MTTPKRIKKTVEEKAIDACAAYLRSKGWNPLVAGFECIEQGSLRYNFRLVLGFTGKPPVETTFPNKKSRSK